MSSEPRAHFQENTRNMQRLFATLMFAACATAALLLHAQSPLAAKKSSARPTPNVGVLVNEPSASQGYTLIAPLQSTKTYLMDMQGRVVRTWQSRYEAGEDAY